MKRQRRKRERGRNPFSRLREKVAGDSRPDEGPRRDSFKNHPALALPSTTRATLTWGNRQPTATQVAEPMRRLQAVCLAAGLVVGLSLSTARAASVPAPEILERSGGSPATLTVIEPHLSAPDKPVEVAYRVFPAPVALAAALGPDWAAGAKTIEFRAIDGYVSRIGVARLASGKAYFAFARADRSPFTVDNLAQNERNIPLGPYYLVWHNKADPELLSEGARDWPYQVADVSVFEGSDAALRPPGFDPALEPGLENAKTHCLTCHKVNGYGGEKAGGDLALVARGLGRSLFVKWALDPQAVQPDTTMPALATQMPETERRGIAASIYTYLTRVPIAPGK